MTFLISIALQMKSLLLLFILLLSLSVIHDTLCGITNPCRSVVLTGPKGIFAESGEFFSPKKRKTCRFRCRRNWRLKIVYGIVTETANPTTINTNKKTSPTRISPWTLVLEQTSQTYTVIRRATTFCCSNKPERPNSETRQDKRPKSEQG